MARLRFVRKLLAVAALALLRCSDSAPSTANEQLPLFRESAAETGLDFHHFPGATGRFYLPEIMGPGVALLDFDSDGDLDVYLLQGGMLDEGADPTQSLFPPKAKLGNRLFENRVIPDGELSFVDSTEKSGLGFETVAMGVAVGDFDGDSDPDMYLTNLGPNLLVRNNGDGKFETVEGPQDTRWSTSASFVDYDSDGDLDLFFANFVDFSVSNNKECFAPTGERDYCIPTVYNPVPDRLFRNDGGSFADVSVTAGLGSAFGNGLGVIAVDLDDDGLTDLYVANDTTENQLWRNVGEGRFEDRAMQVGASVNSDGRAEAGMGVVAADFDGDSDDDLLMTHNVQETNTLYLNNGRGQFTDATNRFGLGNSSMPYTGFGIAWEDFDHDGTLDIFIANGAVAVMEGQRGEPFPFVQPNLFYQGVSGRFQVPDGVEVWGTVEASTSRGLATGDLDLDGDLDLVVTNCNGPVRLYLNQTDGDQWLRIKLEGSGANTSGLGSRVGLCLDDGTCIWQRIHRDGSYLSSSEPVAYFGLRNSAAPRHIDVEWAGGGRERYALEAIGKTLALVQGAGSAVD
ncbi:MAG: CRTAC1 family protein [Acidobacteriia bacterium]|nr:CRTAC1 family protein [Terriglobia bacterium]MYC65779.1 CRTAC1 family protein [Terriglobia bacterium]